mmetsp:Transcript_23161/g.57378  ORF Transcript_23161/g.57378 Transcript_23161/m.57378 type:complete len:248 (+) Transcript_23161:1517-2260(+)
MARSTAPHSATPAGNQPPLPPRNWPETAITLWLAEHTATVSLTFLSLTRRLPPCSSSSASWESRSTSSPHQILDPTSTIFSPPTVCRTPPSRKRSSGPSLKAPSPLLCSRREVPTPLAQSRLFPSVPASRTPLPYASSARRCGALSKSTRVTKTLCRVRNGPQVRSTCSMPSTPADVTLKRRPASALPSGSSPSPRLPGLPSLVSTTLPGTFMATALLPKCTASSAFLGSCAGLRSWACLPPIATTA